MAAIPTVRIKDGAGFKVINADDYDGATMALAGESPDQSPVASANDEIAQPKRGRPKKD